MKRLSLLSIILLICAGCQGVITKTKQPLQNEGELALYLQPWPQEAQRLDVSIESISAVHENGFTIPLALRLAELTPTTLVRQRFIASGELPEGTYRGLAIKVKKASLRTEEGTAALLVPDKETVIDFPFVIKARQAMMASMSLKYRAAVQEGFSFAPVFAPFIPARPLPSLTGYVTNKGSNSLTVFDKKTGEATGVIATGKEPAGMAFDQKNRRAYVALAGDDAVEVIDTVTDTIINRIRLNLGDAPKHVALTPDGKTLLSVNTSSNTVAFLDPFSFIEIGRTTVGNAPQSAVIDATGQRAYVFNYLSNTMTIIDIGARSATATTSTEAGPVRGQLNRKGDRLLVIHDLSPNLLVYDTSSLRTTKRVYTGMGTATLKVDSMTDNIYVGFRFDSMLAIFDPFSLLASSSIFAGGAPSYLTIDGELNNLLISLPEQKTLQLINLTGKNEIATVDVGDEPFWVTVNGER
jgi:YVTN family beta-propeller protein